MSDLYNEHEGKRMVMSFSLDLEFIVPIPDGSIGPSRAIHRLVSEYLVDRVGVNPKSVKFRIED